MKFYDLTTLPIEFPISSRISLSHKQITISPTNHWQITRYIAAGVVAIERPAGGAAVARQVLIFCENMDDRSTTVPTW